MKALVRRTSKLKPTSTFSLTAKHYEKAFRHASKGAWPFSTPEQSYTVSDTTSEAMKAVMGIQDLSCAPYLLFSLISSSQAG